MRGGQVYLVDMMYPVIYHCPVARPLRIIYPGAVYHVTSRGNEQKPVFLDDEDRAEFLRILRHVTERYHWICHVYCLMGNHYHLLIETPDGNLSVGMRQLNGVYTQSFNRRHRRVGHLFQGRFKAILVQKESHLLELCRYVVLNPVRAGMVAKPEEWEWSSYVGTSGMEEPHPCLTTDWILAQFGSKETAAQREYRNFVGEWISQGSIWKDVKAQTVLGQEEFMERFGEYVKGYQDIPEIPKAQRFLQRPSLDSLFNDTELHNLLKRNQAIAKAVEEYGYSQREVADHLGMHFTSISRIMKKSHAKKIDLTLTRAVIWDMDGVLVDTGQFHYRAWRRLLSENGRGLTEKEFLESFGIRSVDILRRALGDRSPEELRQLARRKEEYYREEVAGHVQPLPGVRDILRSLHQAGFSQAIASSAPPKNIGLVLESTGIGEYFDAIVSGDEVSAGKPDPEIFLEAARRLGAAPSRCVVIEDAIAGVEAAVAARMRCIAVTNTNPSEKLSQPDLVVKSLEELSADVLENLLQ